MSKDILFYITEDDGRVRQKVNGVVTSLNKKTPLPYAPIGSSDISILWERGYQYYGNIRNFSLPLGFVRDGADILRNDFYKFNPDRKLSLLIQRYVSEIDATHFRDYYKYLYKGELDFTTLQDQQGENKVEINILEGGLQKALKAQENTKFFIPFDEDAIDILMDGLRITGAYNWTIPEYTSGSTGALPTMVITGEEQKAPGIEVFQVSGGFPLGFGSITVDNTEYFLSDTIPPEGGTGRFEGTINLSNANPSFPMNVSIWVYNAIADTLTNIPLFTGPEATIINIDKEVPLNEGDRFFLDIEEYHHESYLKFTVKTRKEPTTIKAFKPWDLYRKLVGLITGNEDDAYSILLPFCTYMVTSGDGIRGLDGSGVLTSLSDFFKAYNTYLMAGMGVQNGKIQFDGRSVFFTPPSIQPPIDLGNVKDFVCTPANDMKGTTIKIGHTEQDIDDVNGKYDFNGFDVFKTPLQRGTPTEVDLQSPYKAGPYEIEIIRINFDGKLTTDGQQDNQVFVIDCKLEGDNYIPRRDIAVTAGVPDPETIYNVALSPERLLMVHFPWLRSWLFNYDDQDLDFVSATRNKDLIAGGIAEGTDVPISSMGAPMFLPFYFEFETLVPIDLVDTLENSPNRSFQITWNNKQYTGFLIKAGIAPVSKVQQAFKLLATAENNIEELIAA